jgi:hypothetical protein
MINSPSLGYCLSLIERKKKQNVLFDVVCLVLTLNMLHQTNEYTHANENGRNIDQLSPVQSSSSKTADDNQQTVANNKYEPL